MQMLTRISKLILIHPLLWRILGFVSSIVAFTCFALSPSFHDLFGRWNAFKIAIYGVTSLIVTAFMLLIKKCGRITRRRPVLMKTIVGFLVMMLTSLCSIWQDLNSEKEDEENGSRGRILNMCSFGAFGLMSLSWSRQLRLGFEVGISNFLLASFLVLLMKMNFIFIPVAAIFCFMFIYFRYFSDHQMEMRGVILEDIESGNNSVGIQRMDVAEQFIMHKNRLQEHAQRSGIPLPIYQAVKFGLAHAPRFRSAVSVAGKTYTSKNPFPNRKASEQHVAKLALKHIRTGFKDEGLSLILEGPTSFMSILKDYAKKMNLEITYNTVPQKSLGGFKSSLDFNGECYIGDPAKTEMDAEQSAACLAVLSNLENILHSLIRFFVPCQNENQENGSRGRILNMCSFGAFGLMSLSLSRQLQLGFEEGIFNFSFGSLLALLMKMNFKLAPLAATLCYVIIHIRSFSDYFMEKLGRVGSSDTAHEDIESGSRTIHSQPMNAPEHSLHNGISATPEVDTYLTEDENDNLLMLGNRWTLERNRASHKRPNMEAKDDLKAEATSLRLGKEPSTHECSICRLEFWTRQALGGHMRKHEAALHNDTNQVVTKVPVLKRSNSIEVQCLDLNLTPLQNDLNSWFANRDPVFT